MIVSLIQNRGFPYQIEWIHFYEEVLVRISQDLTRSEKVVLPVYDCGVFQFLWVFERALFFLMP